MVSALSFNLLASNISFAPLFSYTGERHGFVFVSSERKGATHDICRCPD